MCFSASASFGAGIILLVAGAASLRKVAAPSQLAFAAIPVIFAIQQTAEGFVWLSLTHAGYASWQQIPMYIYLIFAQLVWPLWIPFALLLLEKNPKRKNMLYLFLGIGVVLTAYLGLAMAIYPVDALTTGYHMQYKMQYPVEVTGLSKIFYGLVTVVPCFVSGTKKMWMLGVAVAISFTVSQIFFKGYTISVWCYFAALISIIIYFMMNEFHKNSVRETILKNQNA